MNLNLLLFAEEGRQQPSPFHQSPHFNQSLGLSPSLRQSPGFSQQGAFLNQTSPTAFSFSPKSSFQPEPWAQSKPPSESWFQPAGRLPQPDFAIPEPPPACSSQLCLPRLPSYSVQGASTSSPTFCQSQPFP